MEKQILHIDCNKFYASVECLLHPELKGKPVAVGGNEESRHGIILTKNEIASKYGLVVGEPLWKAKQKCRNLIIVPPNFPVYIEFSKKVRKILEDYTDLIEPFGLDESWIDVTGDWFKNGREIGFEIKERIRKEIGITVSVGVSYNKVFAKLGSDYKKPNAMTVITKKNYQKIVWPLKCSDMIMVGPATTKKLNNYGIYTIGDIAKSDEKFIKSILGKNGILLRQYARGADKTPVRHKDIERDIKSIGNATTTSRDLVNNNDVKIIFTVLAESVSRRMRNLGLKGTTLSIYVRDKKLGSFVRQCKLESATNVSGELIKSAMALFVINYDWKMPIRSLGLSVTDFDFDYCSQFDFSKTVEKREKLEKIDTAVDALKDRYGNYCIGRGTVLFDTKLSHFSPYDDHNIHPVSPL